MRVRGFWFCVRPSIAEVGGRAGGAAQDLVQSLAAVPAVAQAGFQVDDVGAGQFPIVLDQPRVGLQQRVLTVGHAIGGEHPGDQLLGHVGLVDEVVHAPVEGFRQSLGALPGRQQNDVGVVIVLFVLLAYLIGQFQAVHFRHQPVCDQYAHRALLHLLQGGSGVVGDTDIAVAGIAERAADHHAAELGVVDDEDGKVEVGHGVLLVYPSIVTCGVCRLLL